ncbi:hypothetical protein H0O00_05020 [Candidatus Micrarchaeota archaeon]|nr:hypothetical protein [Candidatus Micrarchaeota archaeon]
MSTGTCIRCGRSSEIEYGNDGLPYCSSCIFYGTNKQCSRCRMYLPATELQQYNGQWACPYCLQDMRDNDRRITERAREKPPAEVLSYAETCERCGRELKGHVYIWNNRRLCKNCLEHEQERWTLVSGKPSGAGQRISVVPVREAKKKSFMEAAISDVLALFGFKRKKQAEIVVYGEKMPIKAAKPMAEKAMAGKREQKRPEAEGLMAIKKKKKRIPRKNKQ